MTQESDFFLESDFFASGFFVSDFFVSDFLASGFFVSGDFDSPSEEVEESLDELDEAESDDEPRASFL